MSISLTTASGDPVSSFGSGNSQFSTGSRVNVGSFGQSALFGTGLASAGQTPTTMTKAASTGDLGYQDPLESRPGAGGGGMQPEAPGAGGGRQLNAPKGALKKDMTPMSAAVKRLAPDKKPGEQMPNAGSVLAGGAARGAIGLGRTIRGAMGRSDNFAAGQSEATTPGTFSASGAADTAEEDTDV